MKKTNIIKTAFVTLVCLFGLGLTIVPTVYANPPDNTSATEETETNICELTNIPSDVRNAAGCTDNADKLPTTIIAIIDRIILVVGIITVAVIVYGGVQYMLSTGDPGKVKRAKDVILYGVIGLAICILAYAIVNFVVIHLIG